jgi:organic hydroperoxide reductase OsmC/OhrA
MPIAFPIEYELELTKTPSEPAELRSGHRPHVVVGPPREFGGSDAWWSPEHLLVSAVASCFTATFLSSAERSELRVGPLRCKAKGVLGRTEGHVAFTSVHLTFEVRVLEDDFERARKMVEDTKARCFVANSLRCPVDLTIEILGA